MSVKSPDRVRNSINRRQTTYNPSVESRSHVQDAHRIVIKAGTSVVSDNNGYPSLTRLGAIVEQCAWLRRMGKEVVLVSSGAVGVGRQLLRKQQLLSSSLGQVIKGDGPKEWEQNNYSAACAAAGQLGLMSLYETLFQNCDTATSQMLVTEYDFRTPERRRHLRHTMKAMISVGVIPIVNENDAVSGNEGYTKDGQFSDNDGLAALVAEQMSAQLLILLTDVDGVYDKAPTIPGAKVLHIYNPKIQVQIGEKSFGGRGGMAAKIAAAMRAVEAGITSVVITNGHSPFSIEKVCSGENVGTLFCSNPERLVQLDEVSSEKNPDFRKLAESARIGSRQLCSLTSDQRVQVIRDIGKAFESNMNRILEANRMDIDEARRVNLDGPLLDRLQLTEKKIRGLIDGMNSLANQEEPIGKCLSHIEVSADLELKQVTTPIGVILVIFESRPDSLPQIASLAIRSGNGLLLKGGKEAHYSNSLLHELICDAIATSTDGKVSEQPIKLIIGREAVGELLKLNQSIDIVIPRGSGALVEKIKNSTKIPVLGHSEGICHIYIDKSADVEKAIKIVVDAKTNYPAACNAVEMILLNEHCCAGADALAVKLINALVECGVEVFGGPIAIDLGLSLSPTPGFKTEFGSNKLNIEVVPNLDAAIDHIHKYGSGHTESIITDDAVAAQEFLEKVDSACVFHNASTRFSDGYRFGLGAEVGISTGRIHARGPVGVQGLLTSKWILRSKTSHTVSEMGTETGPKYTHKLLPFKDGI